VIAERLQFHLEHENLPDEVAELVRSAQKALARAADVVEESAQGKLKAKQALESR
jgi:hypothetical protein